MGGPDGSTRIPIDVAGGPAVATAHPACEVPGGVPNAPGTRRRSAAGVPRRELDPETDEESTLFGRAAAGDTGARDVLFDRYRGFAAALARRYRNAGVAREDLEQVAAIGLVEALVRFDPGRHVRFTTFAGRTIDGELKRYLRDRGWSVRVPRGLQDSAAEVRRAEALLAQRLGRRPTQEEVAEEVGLDPAEVVDAVLAGGSFEAVSLDAPRPGVVQDVGAAERLPAEDHRLEIAPEWADLTQAIRGLTARDRRILELRFFDDLSQSEIAGRVGISQMHVSRLLAKALGTLRSRMEERPARRGAAVQDPVGVVSPSCWERSSQ